MCGIAGFLRLRADSSAELGRDTAQAMLRAVWRRGPDSEGEWRSEDGRCWLGHRRLAIVDLNTGDQPMGDAEGRLQVVFNGEIYNYRALRNELIRRGCRFRTESDTEVLVHGYREWGGPTLVRRLRGIFAFAVYDLERCSLFLARDHLGVKPLHWWSDGDTFLFASEIKSLLANPRVGRRQVNLAGVAQFLVTRYVSRPGTMIRSISKLPEGCYMELGAGGSSRLEPVSYWDVRYTTDGKNKVPFDVAVEQLDGLLKETVRMQLMADVPVGAQLSGGVDSSVIVALMEQIRRESGETDPVKTFSVGFDVERFNEFRYARMVADRYGTEHHEIKVGFRDFVESLGFLCWAYDEPMGEAPGIPTYLMCRKAKEKVTVMLCGEGADEQFGGYRKYALEQYARYLRWLPGRFRQELLRKVAAMLPFKARRVRSVLEIVALHERSSRFASWYGALDSATQSALLAPELAEQVGTLFVREVFDNLVAACDSDVMLEQFFYCDIHSRLVDTLLVKGDRMSMAASVEARVPFLDPHVVEFAARLPHTFKVDGMKTKVLLKKLAERYVPDELIYRRKVGFTMPLTEWFVGPLRGVVRDTLLSERCLARGYYRPDALRDLVDGHIESRVDREQGLWVLLALELWHRIYIDEDGTETAATKLHETMSPLIAN